MAIEAPKMQTAAGGVGSFGGITAGTRRATTPEFLSFTRRGANNGTKAFASIPEDFDWSIPQEPKKEGNNIDTSY